MKTRELLLADEAVLAPLLKHMKIKELERHAQKILQSQGQPDFNHVMSTVIQAIPNLDSNQSNRFASIQTLIKTTLPLASNDSPHDDALIERLAAILMVLITKKFQKIHNDTA